MNLDQFQPKRIRESLPPNKTGPRKAYCKDCGMMLMDSDECCPKCECTETVEDAPAPAFAPYVVGKTRWTKGKQDGFQ